MARPRLVAILWAVACADATSLKHGAAPATTRDGARVVEIPLGDAPDDVAVGPDHVWVTVPGSHRAFPPPEGWLLKVDPASGEVVSRIRVGKRPTRVLWAADAVWVLNSYASHGEAEPTVMRIDPVRNQVTRVVSAKMAGSDMVANDSALWLLGRLGDLTRVELAAPERLATLRRSSPKQFLDASAVAVGEGAVWLLEGNWTRPLVARVHRLDPETGRSLAVVETDHYGTDIAVGLGSIWVVNGRPAEKNGTVSRIDPRTDALVATIPVGPYPFFVAACEDGIWVSNGSTVSRLDPETNRVAEVLDVPFACRRLACGHGALWATRETTDPRKGSLVRILRPARSGR